MVPPYTTSSRTVRAIINKFRELGTNHGRQPSGWPRYSRCLENIESVRKDALFSSNKLVKRRSVQFQLHELSVQLIL